VKPPTTYAVEPTAAALASLLAAGSLPTVVTAPEPASILRM